MKKVNLNIVLGFFLLIIGVLISLQVLNIGIFISYKTVIFTFITFLGLIIMINDRRVSIFPSILSFIGIWNILREYNLINGSIFQLIWPMIIIIIGINLIFDKKISVAIPKNVANNKNALIYNGTFSGIEEKVFSKDFKGLYATATFGGVDLDLRDIEITEDVVINLYALFGGITIILPNKYNVAMGESFSLFGGTDNKYKGEFVEGAKTIYICSKAIFGGTEIK